MIAAGHDLGQKDGDLQLSATLLSEDPVRNAKVEMTVRRVQNTRDGKAVEHKEIFRFR